MRINLPSSGIWPGLIVVALLTAGPTAALAHDGASPTLIVIPEQPAPGDTVEILAADLRLSVLVDPLGHAQRRVSIPPSLVEGSYQLAAGAADGTEVRRELRRLLDGPAPATEGGTQLDPRLNILFAFGAGAAILVLALVIVWSLYHGAAARIHRHRVERRLDRSPDPLFAKPSRRRFGRSDATEDQGGR